MKTSAPRLPPWLIPASTQSTSGTTTPRARRTQSAGVPLVVVPGGGDQWELANRAVRQGSARLIRPLTAEALIGAVGDVLSCPSYRRAARRAGESAAGVADPVRVCREAAR